MATRQRIGADLIHVVSIRIAWGDRGLDRLNLVDVNDGLVSVAAAAVHGLLEKVVDNSPVHLAVRLASLAGLSPV